MKLFLATLPCSLVGMGVLLMPTMLSFGPCGPRACATDLLVVFLRGLLPLKERSNLEILAGLGGVAGSLLPLFWWFVLRKRNAG